MTLSKVYKNIAKIIYPTLTAVNIMTQYQKRRKNTCLFGIMIIIHLEAEMKRKRLHLF